MALGDLETVRRGRNVMLFAGISAFTSAMSSVAYSGLPSRKPKGSIWAWVAGTTLIAAGAAGVTYWLVAGPGKEPGGMI